MKIITVQISQTLSTKIISILKSLRQSLHNERLNQKMKAEKFTCFFSRNIDRILGFELYAFLFLIAISFIYNIDSDAHQYYNSGPYWNSINGLFSLTTVITFGVYFWFCLAFPFVWLTQLILIRSYNINNKKKTRVNLLLIILYGLSVISLFSLYSIGQQQGFMKRKHINTINNITK